jgi:uncharacterized protein YlxW (UPF0749 family)
MRPHNRIRNRYRNSIRLPVILFFMIAGGLVGTRWIKEVRARHDTMRLSTEVRELDHAVTTLRRDIKDLTSRYSALITEDQLKARLVEKHLVMHDIATNTIISLETEPPARFAANLDH